VRRIRLAVIVLGVGLALAAIRFDDRRLTWVAIVVLAVALALRLVTRRSADHGDIGGTPPQDPSASS
jgi:hypothetical protein